MNKIVNAYLEVENLKEKIDNCINKFKIKSKKKRIFSLNNILQHIIL